MHSQVAEESGCRNAYDLKTCVVDASKTNPRGVHLLILNVL